MIYPYPRTQYQSLSAPTSPLPLRTPAFYYLSESQKTQNVPRYSGQIGKGLIISKRVVRDGSPSYRRLSRFVKCRRQALRIYTDFELGKETYGGEISTQSQPGSPSIPRIEIQDFGSEPPPTPPSERNVYQTYGKLGINPFSTFSKSNETSNKFPAIEKADSHKRLRRINLLSQVHPGLESKNLCVNLSSQSSTSLPGNLTSGEVSDDEYYEYGGMQTIEDISLAKNGLNPNKKVNERHDKSASYLSRHNCTQRTRSFRERKDGHQRKHLKRRKPCYTRLKPRITARSKSLNNINLLESDPTLKPCVDKASTIMNENSKLVTEFDRLEVPDFRHPTGSSPTSINEQILSPDEIQMNRRRRLSSCSKISGSEFFTVILSYLDDGEKEIEEFIPVIRGTCLREAISGICDRRGIDIESINVYLEQSNTPLPLLTTETSWLGGKNITMRAKVENKSLLRNQLIPSTPSCTQSRKSSANYRSKTKLFSASYSHEEAMGYHGATLDPNISSVNSSLSYQGVVQGIPGSTSLLFQVATAAGVSGGPTLDSLGISSSKVTPPTKTPKQNTRWSGLWGSTTKDNKMDMLVNLLDTYSKFGIPKLQHNVAILDEDEIEEALYSLESDWTDIVHNSQNLSERKRSQQTGIWELIETEVAYIRTLKVMQDLFLNCLINLQNNQILTEIDKEKLFCNIPEIYVANRTFWHQHLIPIVRQARKTKTPLSPSLMIEGFNKFDDIFRPYSLYCSEQTNCQEYCREQNRSNEVFKVYLAWCETQRDCNRLRLIDILTRPMQRLTKYSLLLKAIQKKTDCEKDYKQIQIMQERVENFVSLVNSQLRHRQENETIKTIIARIESYEPVETRDEDLERMIQNYTFLNLTSPMPGCSVHHYRHLLFEGDLKLKEGSTKNDIHAFLFSDMLLLCKYTTRKQGSDGKLKIIRQPYIIDRLIFNDISKEGSASQASAGLALVYLNEYNVTCAGFTLHSSEPKMIKLWKENLDKAKELYNEAKRLSSFHLYNLYDSCFSETTEAEDPFDQCYSNTVAQTRRNMSRLPSSKMSSIAQSTCGSIELLDSSMAESLAGSVPKKDEYLTPGGYIKAIRSTSFSSEDEKSKNLSTNFKSEISENSLDSKVSKQSSYPTTPRSERKNACPKTTSNVLKLPTAPVSLCSSSSHFKPTIEPTLFANFSVDQSEKNQKIIVPNYRGLSYPPPTSPKLLKRNPPCSNFPRQPQQIKQEHKITSVDSEQQKEYGDVLSCLTSRVVTDAQCKSDSSSQGNRKVPINSGRNDNKRYYTAGAIEDIKKQDTKDNSIQKRLSLNYGHQPPDPNSTTCHDQLKNNLMNAEQHSNKCQSSESMQSSSGVSSTGSLHFSIGSDLCDRDRSSSSLTASTSTIIQTNFPSSPEASCLRLVVNTSPDIPYVRSVVEDTSSSSNNLLKQHSLYTKNPGNTGPSVITKSHSNPIQLTHFGNCHVTTTYITQDQVTVSSSPEPNVVEINRSLSSSQLGHFHQISVSGAETHIKIDTAKSSRISDNKTDERKVPASLKEILLNDCNIKTPNV